MRVIVEVTCPDKEAHHDHARGDDGGDRRRQGERSEPRITYRSGYYTRSLITRVGTLKLRVPRDRMGRFFDRAVRMLPTR